MAAGGLIALFFVTNSSQIAFDSKRLILLHSWNSLVQVSLDLVHCLSHSPAQFCDWAANELFHVADSVLCGLPYMLIHITNEPNLNDGDMANDWIDCEVHKSCVQHVSLAIAIWNLTVPCSQSPRRLKLDRDRRSRAAYSRCYFGVRSIFIRSESFA